MERDERRGTQGQHKAFQIALSLNNAAVRRRRRMKRRRRRKNLIYIYIFYHYKRGCIMNREP